MPAMNGVMAKNANGVNGVSSIKSANIIKPSNDKPYITNAFIDDGEVHIRLEGNDTLRYGFFWLRDNCRCPECYNQSAYQRKKDFLSMPEDPRPQEVSSEYDVLKITWDDDHYSEYAINLLWDCYPPIWKKNTSINRVLWSGDEIKDKVAYVNREDFLNTNEGFRKVLQSVVTYGIAFVDEAIPTSEGLAEVIRRFGPIQDTMWGPISEIAADVDRADIGFLNVYLGPHADNLYFNEGAGILTLQCLEHDGLGGENFVLDGYNWADYLKKNDTKSFNALTGTCQVGEYRENNDEHNHHFRHAVPIFSTDPINGEVRQIKYNEYDRSSYSVGVGKEADEYFKAYRAFSKLVNTPENQWRFKLRPGRVLVMDNWRILHGRLGFTGRRVVSSAYVGRDDWMSAARVLKVVK